MLAIEALLLLLLLLGAVWLWRKIDTFAARREAVKPIEEAQEAVKKVKVAAEDAQEDQKDAATRAKRLAEFLEKATPRTRKPAGTSRQGDEQ